jgi:Rrf2 family protein
MLSSRAKYALRACVHLAEQDNIEQWTLTSDIAAAEDIPHKFLEAILVELRDHNVVQSRRGRYGGHRLGRPPDEISAGELIRIVDGPLALAPCASKTHFGQCADCLDLRACALRAMLREAREAVAGVLDGYSLAMLARIEKKRRNRVA